jgi:hypothetical protein
MADGSAPKSSGAGARAVVAKGPVGQSPRPPGRLPQQDNDRSYDIARRRGRGRKAVVCGSSRPTNSDQPGAAAGINGAGADGYYYNP